MNGKKVERLERQRRGAMAIDDDDDNNNFGGWRMEGRRLG
jgi:hypothetical protein